MHRLAKASAILKGPRVITTPNGSKLVAVCSTPEELRALYGREGFVIEKDRHVPKIKRWPASFNDCRLLGDYVYYNIAHNTGLLLEAEKVAKDNGLDSIIGATPWEEEECRLLAPNAVANSLILGSIPTGQITYARDAAPCGFTPTLSV